MIPTLILKVCLGLTLCQTVSFPNECQIGAHPQADAWVKTLPESWHLVDAYCAGDKFPFDMSQ